LAHPVLPSWAGEPHVRDGAYLTVVNVDDGQSEKFTTKH
jgi:hypothetical protein